MCTAEQHYKSKAANTYTLIRDPRQLVLSQYHHCTESTNNPDKTKIRKHLIGSLDDWLEYWVGAMDDPNADSKECYNPVNVQSRCRYVGVNPADPKWVHPGEALGELQKKFTVIGPMDQTDKVLCVMFIRTIQDGFPFLVTVPMGKRARYIL